MIYIFGLVAAPLEDVVTALAGAKGLQTTVHASSSGAWAFVWEPYEGDEVMPRRRSMLAHTRVVEQMMELGTVLPARFGLLADNIDDIQDLIQAQTALISDEFAKLNGCIEIGVRIRFPRNAALAQTLDDMPALRAERDKLARLGPEGHFARAEFGRKLADALDRRRGEAQKALLKLLTPKAQNHVLRIPEEDTEVLRSEFLVHGDAFDAFVVDVADAAQNCAFLPGAEPEIEIIGPAPMYNFVRLSLAADQSEEAA